MKDSRSVVAFKHALCALLAEKPLEKITVEDLCRISTYSRSAFYKSFYDKYELAKRTVDDEIAALIELFANSFPSISGDYRFSVSGSSPAFAEGLFERINSNRDYYSCIFHDRLMEDTVPYMLDRIVEGLGSFMEFDFSDYPVFEAYEDLLIRTYLSWFFEVAERWELRGFDKCVSDLVTFFSAMFQWGMFENAGVQDGKQVLRFASSLRDS